MSDNAPTPELVALLSCPFCGGDKIQVEAHGYGHYGINCNAAEGGCGSKSGHFHSPSEATKWWNTRAMAVPDGLELEYGGDDSEAGGAVACDIGDYGALDSREWATVLFNDRKFAECYRDEDARLVADALNFYRDHYVTATRAATVPQGVSDDSARLNYVLRKVFFDRYGACLPCGGTKIDQDMIAESIKNIDAAMTPQQGG